MLGCPAPAGSTRPGATREPGDDQSGLLNDVGHIHAYEIIRNGWWRPGEHADRQDAHPMLAPLAGLDARVWVSASAHHCSSAAGAVLYKP